jgi:hypothetical protein
MPWQLPYTVPCRTGGNVDSIEFEVRTSIQRSARSRTSWARTSFVGRGQATLRDFTRATPHHFPWAIMFFKKHQTDTVWTKSFA